MFPRRSTILAKDTTAIETPRPLARYPIMLAIVVSLALIQAEPKFTNTDRDVLLAIVRHNQPKAFENSVVLIGQWTRTGRQKLCDDVLQKEFFGNPLLEEFEASISAASKLKIRLDTVTWDSRIRLIDLSKDFKKVLNYSALKKNFPDADRVFHFNLPAYDIKKEHAIIYGWVGPTHIHSVQLFAYLQLKKNTWSVTWVKFPYYV